jgi:ABC-type Mn2+/Zn2+ transport system ATPase subunit
MRGGGPLTLALLGVFAVLRLLFQERGATLEVKAMRAAVSTLQTNLLETLNRRAVPAYRPAMRRDLARAVEETIPRAAEGALARRRFLGSVLQGAVLLPGLFLLSWKIAIPAVLVGTLAWRILKWKNGSLRDLERSGSQGRSAERRASEEFTAGLEAASGKAWAGYLHQFGGALDAARVADWKWRRAQARYPALLEAGFFFALAGLLMTGVFVLDGLDGWILFTALLVMTYRPVREAARHYPVALQGAVAMEELEQRLAEYERFEPRALPAEYPEPGFFALENVTFGYGNEPGHVVFRNASLKIHAASVTGITGPNGAGKTTLLRLIAGAETPGEGTVWWAAAARAGSGIAYLPQRAHPGADWGAWAALLRKDRPELWSNLDAALRLEKLADKTAGGELPPESLSGGERQRMALARALASTAGYLLLDEPTTGLPGNEREEVLGRALELWKRPDAQGRVRGALVVSHEPFLESLCDSVSTVS